MSIKKYQYKKCNTKKNVSISDEQNRNCGRRNVNKKNVRLRLNVSVKKMKAKNLRLENVSVKSRCRKVENEECE